MFQRILLAVDGSEAALAAARVAARLAAASAADLRVLTVHDAPPGALGAPGYTSAVSARLEEAEAILAAAADEVMRAGGPAPVLDRVLGDPVDGIIDAAAAGRHDLIVVGNRGRGPIAAAVLGSVSTSVATRARVPVLIVPHEVG